MMSRNAIELIMTIIAVGGLLVALVVILWQQWKKKKKKSAAPAATASSSPAPSNTALVVTPTENRATPPWKTDWYINVLEWNLIWRTGLCLGAGVVITSVIGGALWIIGFGYTTWWQPAAIATLIALAFGLPDSPLDENGKAQIEEVPEPSYGALVTWRGMVVTIRGRNFLRLSGKYGWTGRRLGFGRSNKLVEGFTSGDRKKPNEARDGFVQLGPIPFQVWDKASDRENQKRHILGANTNNEARITGTKTINVRVKKPVLLLRAEDPGQTLGDQARQEFRELAAKLTDSDMLALLPHLEDITLGKVVVTAFIGHSVGAYKEGTVVRYRSRQPVLEKVEPGKDVDTVRQKLRDIILDEKRVAPEMRKAVSVTNEDGTFINVAEIEVTRPITVATSALGLEIDSIAYGNMEFSEEVTKAANEASAEAKQRERDVEDAKTKVEVRTKLMPTPKELENPNFERAQLLASDKANIFVIDGSTGSTGLLPAAIVGAETLKGKDKK